MALPRWATWCVLSAVGCTQAARPQGAPPPPSASAPAVASSAHASSAPAASSSPPPEPPRRPTLDPARREIEALLRDVCPLAYVGRRDGHDVGCATCDFATPFDATRFEVEPMPPACAADPTCFGPLAPWLAGTPLRGAFRRPGSDDALLTLAGTCNPKHGAFVLLTRTDGRWTVTGHSPAIDLGGCLAVRRADGRDLAVCAASILSVFGDVEVGRILGLVDGEGEKSLFEIPHDDQGRAACATRSNGRPAPQAEGKHPLVESFVERAEAKDVNRDGRVDVVVHLVEKKLEVKGDEGVSAVRERGVVAGRPTLTFLNDGKTVAADAPTRARLRALCGTPRP